MKDVIVIGAGPGGSTLATLLSQSGFQVSLLEKQCFPRFKIGESLLPRGNAVLKRSGVWTRIEQAGFPKKWAAEFTHGDGRERVHNVFAQGLLSGWDYTYQVDRARFDSLLLDHARSSGAEVLQPVQIREVREIPGRGWSITATDDSGQDHVLKARFLADASGRACVLARHLGLGKRDIQLPSRMAVFSHFTGVPRAKDRFGGDIRIVRIPRGWFWVIPIDAERTSVGLVFCQKDRPRGITAEAFFHDQIARHPLMRKWMAAARAQMEFHTDADFSYIHSSFAGDRHVLLGDAAAFLDPVFSSGVYLSLEAASSSADMISSALRKGKCLRRGEIRRYERNYLKRLKTMESLIRVFYDERQFPVFMNPRPLFQLPEAVNSIVAGHTLLPFALRWRYALFLGICKLNRYVDVVPPVSL